MTFFTVTKIGERLSQRVFRIIFFSSVIWFFLPTFFAFDLVFGKKAFLEIGQINSLHFHHPYLIFFMQVLFVGTAVFSCFNKILKTVIFLNALLFVLLLNYNPVFFRDGLIIYFLLLYFLLAFTGRFDYKITLASEKLKNAISIKSFFIIFIVIGNIFFNGLEKILQGWFKNHTLNTLLHYPPHTYLREWVYSTYLFQNYNWGVLGSYLIPILEVTLPLLLLIKRIRPHVIIILITYFALWHFVVEIPLENFALLFGATLLLFSDNQINSFSANLKKYFSNSKKFRQQNILKKIKIQQLSFSKKIMLGALVFFVIFSALWPLRHFFIRGDVHFTREGDWFAWRVMSLQATECSMRFYDKNQKEVELYQMLTEQNYYYISKNPYLIWRLAKQQCDKKTNLTQLLRSETQCIFQQEDKPVFLFDPSTNLCTTDYYFLKHNSYIFENYNQAKVKSENINPKIGFEESLTEIRKWFQIEKKQHVR